MREVQWLHWVGLEKDLILSWWALGWNRNSKGKSQGKGSLRNWYMPVVPVSDKELMGEGQTLKDPISWDLGRGGWAPQQTHLALWPARWSETPLVPSTLRGIQSPNGTSKTESRLCATEWVTTHLNTVPVAFQTLPIQRQHNKHTGGLCMSDSHFYHPAPQPPT